MSRIVVIPVYEPEECLEELAEQVMDISDELIIVDDGSADTEDEIWERISHMATVLHHPYNRGKGAAIKTALEYIKDNYKKSDVIGIMDGDGQHLPTDMNRLLLRAEQNHEALILGVRSVGEKMPLRSRIGNQLTRGIFRVLSGEYISDTQSGLRAFSGKLIPMLLKVEGERYEYETNVLMELVKQGIPVVELPIQTVYKDQENSTSHFHVIRDSIRIYGQLFKFTGSSLLSFAVDYVLFGLMVWILPEGVVELVAANAIARVFSATFNYTMNTRIVFQKKMGKTSALQYMVLAIGIFFMNNMILNLYAEVFGLPVMEAKLLTELTLFILSFTIQRFWIFRKSVKEDHLIRRAVL